MIESGAILAHREKCTQLRVQIVEKSRRFHLSRTEQGPSIVGNAIKSTNQGDFKSDILGTGN